MTEATFRARAFPSVALAAGATFVVAGVLNTAGVFSEVAIHWTNWLIGFAFAAVAIAIVFGVFVRRASRSPDRAWRTGLVLGVLGVLTVWAYWSGLRPFLASARSTSDFFAVRRRRVRKLGDSASARHYSASSD